VQAPTIVDGQQVGLALVVGAAVSGALHVAYSLALIAVLSPLAYVLMLFAMQTAPVAVVAPLRESSIILGSLLAGDSSTSAT
jgi:hypothetical protein